MNIVVEVDPGSVFSHRRSTFREVIQITGSGTPKSYSILCGSKWLVTDEEVQDTTSRSLEDALQIIKIIRIREGEMRSWDHDS